MTDEDECIIIQETLMKPGEATRNTQLGGKHVLEGKSSLLFKFWSFSACRGVGVRQNETHVI